MLSKQNDDCLQSSANSWCKIDDDDPETIFVNLQENKESYTAFEGQQIWKAIYSENCMFDSIKKYDLANTCKEETLLFHLVSGLHTSINMHVAHDFFDTRSNSSFSNIEYYESAIGQFKGRLKNLFFIYAVVLRSVNRLGEYLVK